MNNINKTPNEFLEKLKREPQEDAPAKNGQLTQQDFFKLLTHQLSMQDPFKPMQNNEMINQMTSFASLDGINSLKDEIVNLNSLMSSSQALQASSLVGQRVLLNDNSAYLTQDSGLSGSVDFNGDTKKAVVQVLNDAGTEVASFPVSSDIPGSVEFFWDGSDAGGNKLKDGLYTLALTNSKGEYDSDIKLSTYNKVSSVSLGAVGTTLNLLGGNSALLNDVLAVTTS